jgi:hypothetical protein
LKPGAFKRYGSTGFNLYEYVYRVHYGQTVTSPALMALPASVTARLYVPGDSGKKATV